MAKPLPLTDQHYEYPLKPAALDLATEVGKAMVSADPARLALLNRIYLNMTSAARARCLFAGSVAAIGGEVQS